MPTIVEIVLARHSECCMDFGIESGVFLAMLDIGDLVLQFVTVLDHLV